MALLRDLESRTTECHPSLDSLDFIVFSGDLAFRGAPEEYDKARREFLEPLLRITGLEPDRIVMVPGNHDLDRSRLSLLPDLLRKFGARSAVADVFQDDARSHLLFPLSAYTRFVSSFQEPSPCFDPAYGFAKTFETRSGARVSVPGLNSAWMCGQCQDPYTTDVNDYGRLILGEHLYRKAMAESGQADVRIAVMHHPFHWLSEVEQRAGTERDLMDYCHFILRGHEHRSALSVPVGTAGNCAVISAGAAYDRREYPNGYNFVVLDLDRGQGTLFLRPYVDDRRRFAKDTDTTGDDSPGIVTFTLPKDLAHNPEREVGRGPSAGRIVGNPRSIRTPATMQAMAEIFSRQHEQTPVHYRLATLVVKANSLLDLSKPDEVVTSVSISARDTPLYCHRISLLSSPGSEYLGQASWRVGSADGSPLEAIEMPVAGGSRRSPVAAVLRSRSAAGRELLQHSGEGVCNRCNAAAPQART